MSKNFKFSWEEYAKKAREAQAEGVVLLKNDNDVLPILDTTKVSLFGRTQFNYYKSGTGSGGLVNTSYVVGVYEALKECDSIILNEEVRAEYEKWLENHPFDTGAGWAQEPWFQEEMPLGEEFVNKAAQESDLAIIIIGRTAGEDKDNAAKEGSYLITQTEEDMLKKVCAAFEKTVVILNVGNIIDMKWVKKYNPSAVLYTWQGGQEGGRGIADCLLGEVSPSGRLTDTIAEDINDYFSVKYHGDAESNSYVEDIYVGYRYFETFAKEKVVYPFGFGLSYTSFNRQVVLAEKEGGEYFFQIQVTNTGDYPGKDSCLLFVEAPQGELGKPARSLCGFNKTSLLAPGDSEILNIIFKEYDISSYDDSGTTGNKSCYVLEAGDYNFYLGGDVRSAKLISTIKQDKLKIVRKLSEAMAPVEEFDRIKPRKDKDTYCISYEPVPLRTQNWMDKRNATLPKEIPYTGDLGYKLKDVRDGKVTMDEFIGQFSKEALIGIIRGEGMSPGGVTPGIAGAFGGVREDVTAFGVPKGGCADGPSGIRMDCGAKAFAMPNGTCLACTFNEKLLEELYEFEGMELRKNHVDTLLGPGMNIHRNPLNGRNFEYFSEDPLVTGRLASAQLKGMHKYSVTGTIKHFACNNQEYMRSHVNCAISERALREIYLKGYEIAVKEGGAFLIMTSYNRINGIHAASNYDLLTRVLRGEWKFNGAVMTDWWAQGNEEGEKAKVGHTAVMVRAQNDLFMVMPDAALDSAKDTTKEGLSKGQVTISELQRSAANICGVLLRLPALTFMLGEKTPFDYELDKVSDAEDDGNNSMIVVNEDGTTGEFWINDIECQKGNSSVYDVRVGGGLYKIEFECCVCEGMSPLAQVPVSVFRDRNVLKTITLTGEDTQWRKIEIENVAGPNASFFIKFYFGQTGMKIRNCKLVRIFNQEKFMEQIQKMREEGEAF